MPRELKNGTQWLRMLELALATSVGLLSTACLGGVKVDAVRTSVQPPSDVAFYLSVRHGELDTSQLDDSAFAVYEDGQLLDRGGTDQKLLFREDIAIHRALLLVDMSGAMKEAEARDAWLGPVSSIVAGVQRVQPVTVFAYDGAGDVVLLGEFPAQADATAEDVKLPRLTQFRQRDASSNLNGAVLAAHKQLDGRLGSAKKPVRLGSVIVLAQSPDLARRVTDQELAHMLDASQHDLYLLTVGDATREALPSRLGASGTAHAANVAELGTAANTLAGVIARRFHQYYALSYCSPARAGQRQVTVEVTVPGKDGETERGSFDTTIDASGFRAGCTGTTKPRFAPLPESKAERTPAPTTTPRGPARGAATTQAPGPASEPKPEVVPPPDRPGYD